ncbi:hypothetical protein [Pedobacter sp. SYP-B3415]|uniref:hypothetical protein n=1 Tax=Pedobacter sp. SYP-B3415 TaxID=2496641 RepID=UPI00101BDB55|nr:hypothetical protein [Pedobacter sp. SYP-B3415]
MRRYTPIFIVLCAVVTGCMNRHFYQQEDYPFYRQPDNGSSGALLRTDGVYVLQQRKGDTATYTKPGRMYKFYPGRQFNMVLGLADSAPADSILKVFNQEALKTRTLFQGYFKNQADRLILQNVHTARRQFNYHYAIIGKDRLIIKASTHQGRGKFSDKYFENGYTEVYHFREITGRFADPRW